MHIETPSFRSRKPIEAYGDGGFRLGGVRFEGSLLLLPERMEQWPVDNMDDLSIAALGPITDLARDLEFVLLGCGPQMRRPPAEVTRGLLDLGLGLEFMDTGAACRLYNVLIAEDRAIAAALIAIE